MKAGYIVSGDSERGGFAVVAESELEAIAVVWDAELRDWCDPDYIECLCLPAANIKGLPTGMVTDERDALCRGLYDFLQEKECDRCKKDDNLVCHKGRALCEDCIWDLTHGDDDK